MKTIKIPEKKRKIEYEIKKSKFIATVEPLNDQNHVKKIVKAKKAQYPGCSHVVYAFFLNDDRSISGLSDDGEPHGTAGRPVYEVLKGSGLTDILLTVTRFFGGTKLGTGGLVSAYGHSAKNVLENLSVIEKIYTIKLKIKLSYKAHENVKQLLEKNGAKEISENFGTDVTISAEIPIEKKKDIEKIIKDFTRGEFQPEYEE